LGADWGVSLLMHAPSAASLSINSCQGGSPALLITFLGTFLGAAVPLLLTYSYERAAKRRHLEQCGYRVG
jgi:hypothetical protein